MKFRINSILFFVILHLGLQAQVNYPVEDNYRDCTFTGFTAEIEKKLPVKFFYREDWVKDLKIGDYPACNNLPCFLDKLFEGTGIHYFIEESGNIIITGSYAVKIPGKDYLSKSDFLSLELEDSNVKIGKEVENGLTEIGNPAEKSKPGKAIISGYIKSSENKEPLPGITVVCKKLSIGTVSNEFGYFSLSLPRGIHLLEFYFTGFKDKSLSINVFGSGEMNVVMQSVTIPLKEVVVKAEKNETLQRFEVGTEKINMATVKLLPTSLGEIDILKSVLLLTGVQSAGEGSMGFNIRGGTTDQNLILLYGAPVYNSSHFFGFFSAVNSDIIKDVTLYKGGIPSRYGGRISSVMDIGSKEGNGNKFAGNAGISPVTTHLMVEGPILKGKLSYLLAGRTTYSNWIFSLFDNPALQNSKASFYDLNGKISYDLNDKNKFELSAYYSSDAFKLNSDTLYKYKNNILAFSWRHFFNSRFFLVVSANQSRYEFEISTSKNVMEAFKHTHKIISNGYKANFNWFQGKHEVNYGMEMTAYNLNPGEYNPDSDSSLVIPQKIEKEQAWEGAIYADDKFTLNKILSLNLGIRVSGFYAFGPQNIMLYESGYPKSVSTINDTLMFKKGEVEARYAGPEYRVSLNFRFSDRNSLKLNYNRTRQYLHLLSNTTSVSPTDTWKLCDYYLKPQVGDQFAIGFYSMLFNKRYEFSAESYYKIIRNMVDFKGGTNLVMNDNIEKDIVNVNGKAYGLELVFKKNTGKLRYSLGYTYSRIFIKSEGQYPEENINSGNWFPSNYDKPNDLVFTLFYTFSRRYSFSTSYIYNTGRPITFPVATYVMYNDILVHYSDRNKYRIPDYSRLDIAFRVNGNLKSRKIAHPSFTFSVYNLLGRQNVYSVYFRKEGDIVKGYKLSVFATAIPTVTFSFDF
ncbi:MAG: TonB-dependent receptor [Bacteroidales bacterium]